MQRDCLPRTLTAFCDVRQSHQSHAQQQRLGGLSGTCRGCGVAGHPPVKGQGARGSQVPMLHWFVNILHSVPRLLLKLLTPLSTGAHFRHFPWSVSGLLLSRDRPCQARLRHGRRQMTRTLESGGLSGTLCSECFVTLTQALPPSPVSYTKWGTGLSQGDCSIDTLTSPRSLRTWGGWPGPDSGAGAPTPGGLQWPSCLSYVLGSTARICLHALGAGWF